MSAGVQKLKSRIKSAKNIAQITKAMEMVSASKMRKAQERAVQSKPYAQALSDMLSMIGTRSNSDSSSHPLLGKRKEVKKALVALFTSDKGLAGAFHANLFRYLSKFERKLLDRGIPVHYVAYGKKGRDFLRYTKRSMYAVFETVGDKPATKGLRPLVTYITEEFVSGRADEVYLVYSEFTSTLVQKATHRQLLPFSLAGLSVSKGKSQVGSDVKLIPLFEPNQDTLLGTLLPYAVEYMVYESLLQNLASEHSARMIAMKNANENAREIGSDLLLMFNQIRQATITQQIAEISSASMSSA